MEDHRDRNEHMRREALTRVLSFDIPNMCMKDVCQADFHENLNEDQLNKLFSLIQQRQKTNTEIWDLLYDMELRQAFKRRQPELE